MKDLLVTITILLTVAAARADIIDSYMEVVKDSVVSCGKEIGLTGESPRDIFEKDSATGLDQSSCLRACILKSVGNMKDSKLDLENINKFISLVNAGQPDMIKPQQEVAVKCIEKAKDMSDECKTAYTYIQCFLDSF